MEDHYQYDDTNIFLAAWRSTRMCQFVNDKGDIVFFQNANGLGINPGRVATHTPGVPVHEESVDLGAD
jgi:hypothetical protein